MLDHDLNHLGIIFMEKVRRPAKAVPDHDVDGGIVERVEDRLHEFTFPLSYQRRIFLITLNPGSI